MLSYWKLELKQQHVICLQNWGNIFYVKTELD